MHRIGADLATELKRIFYYSMGNFEELTYYLYDKLQKVQNHQQLKQAKLF